MSDLRIRTKLAYGIGQIAESVLGRGFDIFVLFYFTQVLGLPGTLAGLAVFIALCFDAVTDPLVGFVSDRWRSPRGRRHPFMYASAFPVAACWYLLLTPPAGLSETQLFLWLVAFAVLVRAAMTLYHVPHMAMGAELSNDYHERTSVVAWRMACSVAGAGLIFGVGVRLLFPESADYPNGMLNPDGYPRLAWVTAVLMFGTIWWSAWGTRDRIPHMPRAPELTDGRSFLGDLRSCFTSRSFLLVFATMALFMTSSGISTTVHTFLYVFFWEFDTKQIGWVLLPSMVGYVPGIMIARRLHERFDKKPTVMFALVCSLAFGKGAVILRLLGLFPSNESPLVFPLVLVFLALAGVGAGLAGATVSSMMADVAEEHEVNSGLPQQGIFFSALSFSSKLSSGIGHFIAGVGLDLIRFPLENPEAVTPQLVTRLGLLSISGLVFGVTSIVAMSRYRLARADHDRARAVLEARHQGA